jgi:hypothetical protein
VSAVPRLLRPQDSPCSPRFLKISEWAALLLRFRF